MSKKLKIAVVGAGIGGCSTAYFARQHFPEAEIVVFEKEDTHVGGRIASIEVDGQHYEAGASILHSKNKYMVDFVKELGFEKGATLQQRLGLFNGQEFVMETSDYQLVTIFRMIWRYGLNVFKLKSWVGEFLASFGNIYKLQEQGQAFSTPEKLVEALDKRFPEMLFETLRERLLKDGFMPKFAEEFAYGIMRVNYGQDLDIGAFVGSVSLAGAGGELWCVQGGNETVPQGLLKKADCTLLNGCQVEKIVGKTDGSYTVVYSSPDKSNGKESADYDIVFLCAPQNSQASSQNIAFEDLGRPISDSIAKAYHRTVATFVKGEVSPKPFHKDSVRSMPGSIFTTTDKTIFNSVGIYAPVDGDKTKGKYPVWKIFSQEPLSMDQLSTLFPKQQSPPKAKGWSAYPDYRTAFERRRIIPFEIDSNNLYYVNAIEGCASAMEMSVIGAKNCVLLAENKLKGTMDKIDPPNKLRAKL